MAASAVEVPRGVLPAVMQPTPTQEKSQAMESVEDIVYGSVRHPNFDHQPRCVDVDKSRLPV